MFLTQNVITYNLAQVYCILALFSYQQELKLPTIVGSRQSSAFRLFFNAHTRSCLNDLSALICRAIKNSIYNNISNNNALQSIYLCVCASSYVSGPSRGVIKMYQVIVSVAQINTCKAICRVAFAFLQTSHIIRASQQKDW